MQFAPGTGLVLVAGMAIGSVIGGVAHAQSADGSCPTVRASGNAGASANGTVATGTGSNATGGRPLLTIIGGTPGTGSTAFSNTPSGGSSTTVTGGGSSSGGGSTATGSTPSGSSSNTGSTPGTDTAATIDGDTSVNVAIDADTPSTARTGSNANISVNGDLPGNGINLNIDAAAATDRRGIDGSNNAGLHVTAEADRPANDINAGISAAANAAGNTLGTIGLTAHGDAMTGSNLGSNGLNIDASGTHSSDGGLNIDVSGSQSSDDNKLDTSIAVDAASDAAGSLGIDVGASTH